MSQAAGTNNQRGLFGGISLAAESEIRRPPADLPVDDLVDLRRLAARRRHVAELMERSAGNAAWVLASVAVAQRGWRDRDWDDDWRAESARQTGYGQEFPTWEVDEAAAVRLHTSTVRGWVNVPVHAR